MSAPYSLANPPQAPEKKTERKSLAERRGRLDRIPKLVFACETSDEEEEEEKKPTLPEWRKLAESGWIQPKYLRYNPDDVAEIDDIDMLLQLQKWYFPASQPRNLFEQTYLKLMLDAVETKLYTL